MFVLKNKSIQISAQGTKNLLVTNISGRVVHLLNMTKDKIQVDMNFLQPEIYFIGLQNKPGIKFVKN